MKKIVGLILLVALLTAGCTTAGDQATPTPTPTAVSTASDTPAPTVTAVPSYTDLSPAEAKDLIDTTPDLVIIDVSPAYDAGHLPGAVHYYLGDGSLDAAIPTLDKEGIYLVYCHVDSVAIAGAQKLVDAGFMNVYRLEGNYGAWVDAGYPVET